MEWKEIRLDHASEDHIPWRFYTLPWLCNRSSYSFDSIVFRYYFFVCFCALQLEKKSFYHLFMCSGFTGFDGDFSQWFLWMIAYSSSVSERKNGKRMTRSMVASRLTHGHRHYRCSKLSTPRVLIVSVTAVGKENVLCCWMRECLWVFEAPASVWAWRVEDFLYVLENCFMWGPSPRWS